MAPELVGTSPARKRFQREARATAAVRHSNVVGIYHVEDRPHPFLVMKFVDGISLQLKLDRTGPLPVPDVVDVALQIARGLAAAHATGLIHRDIKPANILLETGTGRVKITDFGLARTVDDASLTRSGQVIGTPLYMSPEQAQGLSVDQRSDLFSLGSVMYVMASGRPPFRASTTLGVLKRVVEDRPRPIDEVLSDVPEWLIAIISKLHAKDREDRFGSAAEVGDLLERCQAELRIHGRVVSPELLPGRQENLRPWWPRRRIVAYTTAAAFAVLVVALAIGLGLVDTTPPATLGPVDPSHEPARTGHDVPIVRPTPNTSTVSHPITGRIFRGHSSRVARVLFTPDGERLVSASNGDHHVIRGNTRYHVTGTDNTVRVWNVATGQEIRRFPMTAGRHYGPQGIAVTPDGRYVAASSSWIWANGPPEPRVYVWDLSSGDRKYLFDLDKHAIRSVNISPDGGRVSVARSGSGGITSWSLVDGRSLGSVELSGIPDGVEAPQLTWSPDGQFLLSSTWNGSGDFLGWDAATGEVAKRFVGHTAPPNHIVMSADGSQLLSCANDYSVRLWDWDSGRELRRWGNLDSAVQCVAFSPTGDRVLTGSDNGTITLRKVDTDDVIGRFTGHDGAVNDVTFSPSETAFASAGEDHTVRVWDRTRLGDMVPKPDR